MKKIFSLLVFVVIIRHSWACVYFDPDAEYYNLFIQEIINDPRYHPFLLSLESAYYTSNYPAANNENIEEWQQYLQLSYEDTYYLVFKSSRDDISAVIKGKPATDAKLKFLTPGFVKKHKQSLLYLSYAKYLEPYMHIIHASSSDWDYFPEDTKTVDNLDYDKVMNVLMRSWNAETDQELKLRYGYQLVRFAHYNRKYDDAINLFDKYVAPLNYKPAMYYYALAQKAGAMKGNGDVAEANGIFFKVFCHSGDLKEMAVNSIRLNDQADFKEFLNETTTTEEKCNAYLLLGYMSFSNPLNETKKIASLSPDAIQAKVLMARAVNQIEREIIPLYHHWNPGELQKIKDKRFPVAASESDFLKETLDFAKNMAGSAQVKDKNFWNITSAYLFFLNKDFASAKAMLAKVNAKDEIYELQKKNLAVYIGISEHAKITPELESEWYARYADVFKAAEPTNSYQNSSSNFVIDVLANRYFLQKDYAKSFLLNNEVSVLERNPQMELIDEIEKFYQKGNKTELEKYILNISKVDNIQDYIHYLRGVVYLNRGDLNKANTAFQHAPAYAGALEISDRIFGYNAMECFECNESDMMSVDYLDEFTIPDHMDYATLTKTLIELNKAGSGKDERSAKAGYLLGNFFYNTTPTGYFRNILRFSDDNSYYSNVYNWFAAQPDIFSNIYFKYYSFYYTDALTIAQQYLEKAYQRASDAELKARIAFALSKCEQEAFYKTNNLTGGWYSKDDQVLIRDRKYFGELFKYRQTEFFAGIQTSCKYFDYYINQLGN